MPVGSKLVSLLSTSFPLRPFIVLRLARFSRHPRAAFSSTAVFHGRFHSVFICPKLGFWSGPANQFHSETVINNGYVEVATSFHDTKNSHPWPEWSRLADLLVEKGYSERCITSGDDDDSFLVNEDLPEKFLKAAEACLGFARDRPDILRLLAKKNVEAIVLNGSPLLFKNGDNSARRMKLFLSGEGSSELELEKAQTIDIMRYVLSYVYGPLSSSDGNKLKSDELVERSVRKLLGELFNLTGTVWKPKSVDATSTELPLSNEQLSRHPGQYIETRSGDWIYPKIPGQSSAASENQSSALSNFTDAEYGKRMVNQKQGPEETPSSQTGDRSTSNGGLNANSAQPSSSVLDKNVESGSRAQTSSTSNGQISNETNAAYGSTNSSQPPSHLGNNYNTYYGGYTGRPTLPSGNLLPNSSSTSYYAGSTAKLSPQPGNSLNDHRPSFDGYNVNSTQPSSNPTSNSSTFYGGPTTNSTQPPRNSWDNNNTAYAGYSVSSARPSSTSWVKSNTPYGGSTVNSSQPPSDSWSNYNTSYSGCTANSTQPSSTFWSNNNRSYGESTPNFSRPPSDYQGNYNSQYDGYLAKSNQTSSKSWSNNDTSHAGSTSNSSQPPSNSWNSYSSSHGGFTEKSTQPSTNSWNTRNTPYSASTAYSPQPPRDSWNKYNSPYGEDVMKSTQTSSNSWSNNNTSFGGPTASSSQPPSNLRNDYNTNPTNSAEPSTSSWNRDNSYVGFSADSYRGYPTNSKQPSSYLCNNSSTSYPGASANPPQPSSNAWNNSRESCSSGFPQANNGLPSEAQTQNVGVNGTYGYSGKSLEGSCVKEPDPLDMSEEAKAERWFRRAAQIKDISELSQIPDEDFPQIMPMRKGVNRFVVSKRKTPLERRLASQQFKRSLPVVSSEPEKEPTAGESETQQIS